MDKYMHISQVYIALLFSMTTLHLSETLNGSGKGEKERERKD